ncbi:DoxX family protein [Rhizobium sp. S163]|uniref:DoxX family protein n=1 Tax=Rhizobium sp. S163 TaxID=3055039 RepID=UPI0025AA0E5D|nr:DoxX family protein [Rhizobium sp. S163]MDM9648694.1 DoxX family protein [Rhizobium sp. S163]
MSVMIGRILSVFVIAALVADGAVNLVAPNLLQAEMEAVQFPFHLASVIGALCIVSALLYAVPVTAFLGAVMITGFLGGAICTHLRVGEILSPPQFVSLVLGTATWLGLYLQDTRLRSVAFTANRN